MVLANFLAAAFGRPSLLSVGKREHRHSKSRGTITGVLMMVGVLVLALGAAFAFGNRGSGSVTAAAQTPQASAAPAASSEAPADLVLVPQYPTRADAVTAFVSEVAGMDSWNGSVITSTTLGQWKARVGGLGNQVCRETDVEDQMRVLDGLLSDQVDQIAFTVEAAYYLCNDRIASMGQGIVATGELTPVPVTPKCPSEPDFRFDVQDTSSSTDFSQPDWTTTVRNNSAAGALVYVEQRIVSDDWTSDWTLGGRVGDYDPQAFSAHDAQQYTESNSGVHDNERPEYRLREGEFIALNCGHSTTELRNLLP